MAMLLRTHHSLVSIFHKLHECGSFLDLEAAQHGLILNLFPARVTVPSIFVIGVDGFGLTPFSWHYYILEFIMIKIIKSLK